MIVEVKSQPQELQTRLIDFAVRIINVIEALPSTNIASQLVRSGTSPAPNYGEAQSAESRRDFIHKMKVALKELRESVVWLKIIERKPLVESGKMTEVIKECDELIAIFAASVKTADSDKS